ncbi:MAG: ClbS/DfsB family four-helix bundle protein [Parasphingorhabdus sp.]
MAATNKSELLEITQKEFEKLEKLLSSIDSDCACDKDEDQTSIKDVVTHRAHWIGLFFGWYEDGLMGREVYFPAQGYKWNELKQYNAQLRQQHADIDWQDALAKLRDSFEQLVDFIDTQANDELYGGPMKGANKDWTPGRWAEAAGASHFRSASKYVRSRLRNLK